MKSGIYKIENKITKDIYIGSSINLSNRKSRHFKDLERNIHHSIILQRAVNKYNIKNFEFIVLENCAKEKLIEREQYYLDLLQPLYNILSIAGSSLGCKHSKETILKHKKYSLLNNVKPPESTWKEKQQKVYMLDKETLKIIKIFDSLSQACRFLNKRETFVSTISSCCNNKRFSAFGYRWSYSIEDISKLRCKKLLIAWNKCLKINNKKHKKVKQYDLKGNFLKEFTSVKEAEQEFGKGISNCALGKSKTSNGYIWKY